MIKKMNHWYFKWSKTSYGPLMLFIAAFADSSFFPMPVVILFITLALAKPENFYRYTVAVVAGTLIGAIGGWSIGHFLWLDRDSEYTRIALYVFEHVPGLSPDLYEDIRILYGRWGIPILASAVLTPIPFKYFTISAGVFNMNLFVFIMATLVSQTARFIVIGLLIKKYGSRIKDIIHQYFKPVAILITASIIIALIMIKIF